MNQNTITWGIVVVVLIGLGFWYASSQSAMSTDNGMATTSAATTSATGESPTATGGTKKSIAPGNTFHSIFSQNGSHECDYAQVTSAGQVENKIFIADGKMRGEFRTVTAGAGAGTANLMVYNGGTLYAWQEGKTTGTKTTIKTVSDLPTAIPTDLTSGGVVGSQLNSVGWTCHDWIKDSSMLTPPTYVAFY